MTISYNDSFLHILLYWKGSLYKEIWKDLLIFTLLYYCIHLIFVYFLDDAQKLYFTSLRDNFEQATHLIPVKFILGFFVTSVMARWWCQLQLLEKPDKLMLHVIGLFEGDQYRLLRRTVARWINLASALTWRELSLKTMKRFPTVKHFMHAGMMTQKEYILYAKTDNLFGKWFLPIVWLTGLLEKCRAIGVINSRQMVYVMNDIFQFHRGPAQLYFYQWICIPLLYTQVATIAVYGYFAVCLIGRQVVDSDPVPIPFPIFTCLQLVFFIGWLKVAQTLINPFGEDEDDFELNYMLERNLHIALNLADGNGKLKLDLHKMTPNTLLSVYKSVPYTKASTVIKEQIPKGHTRKVKLSVNDLQVIHVKDSQFYHII